MIVWNITVYISTFVITKYLAILDHSLPVKLEFEIYLFLSPVFIGYPRGSPESSRKMSVTYNSLRLVPSSQMKRDFPTDQRYVPWTCQMDFWQIGASPGWYFHSDFFTSSNLLCDRLKHRFFGIMRLFSRNNFGKKKWKIQIFGWLELREKGIFLSSVFLAWQHFPWQNMLVLYERVLVTCKERKVWKCKLWQWRYEKRFFYFGSSLRCDNYRLFTNSLLNVMFTPFYRSATFPSLYTNERAININNHEYAINYTQY